MEDAYEVKITRTLHSFHNVNKTRCDVKFVKFHEEMYNLKMCLNYNFWVGDVE